MLTSPEAVPDPAISGPSGPSVTLRSRPSVARRSGPTVVASSSVDVSSTTDVVPAAVASWDTRPSSVDGQGPDAPDPVRGVEGRGVSDGRVRRRDATTSAAAEGDGASSGSDVRVITH